MSLPFLNRKISLSIVCLFCLLFLNSWHRPEAKEKPLNILFLLADDWSYPYGGLYGKQEVPTPNLDKLAKQGVLFNNAYCSTPSCTASRASMLTGMYPHNLGEGVNLCGRLDISIPTYVQILRKQGYEVGFDKKGWAPGDFKKMGYTENPVGTKTDFSQMLKNLPEDKPFFFWFGTNDPHRPFVKGSGKKAGFDINKIDVPPFLPNVAEVREDLADYYSEIMHFDQEIGELLAQLKASGRLENTIIVVASDNGMPFPHAKANLYDQGTRVPLLVASFGGQIPQGKIHSSYVNLMDLTPTFLDWAAVPKQAQPKMDGKTLLPVLAHPEKTHRSEVYLERERHCLARADFEYGAGYPIRALRTGDYLYIRNLRPDRNPAGDESIPNTPSVYGDVDGGYTKNFMMDHREEPNVKPLFALGFGKRPAEELYNTKTDPYNLHNLAASPALASIKQQLSKRMDAIMMQTKDPRRNGGGDEIDRYRTTSRAWVTRDGLVLLDE